MTLLQSGLAFTNRSCVSSSVLDFYGYSEKEEIGTALPCGAETAVIVVKGHCGRIGGVCLPDLVVIAVVPANVASTLGACREHPA